MKTIALRFGEQFAPACGTIEAHKAVLEEKGFVWYGKLGLAVADKNCKMIMNNENPQILLICGSKHQRYWAAVQEIQKAIPNDGIPEYYSKDAHRFKTWFKITSLEKATDDIMSKCIVVSSRQTLGEVTRHSMSPFFLIEYN